MARASVSAAVILSAWSHTASRLPLRRQMGWELTPRWMSDAPDSWAICKYWSTWASVWTAFAFHSHSRLRFDRSGG